MKLEDIIQIEGIVIRKIPIESVSLYDYNTYKKFLNKPNTIKIYCDVYKRYIIKETRQNSLGGKFLVMKENSQGSTLRFNLKYCGIGDTIENAYADFLNKN